MLCYIEQLGGELPVEVWPGFNHHSLSLYTMHVKIIHSSIHSLLFVFWQSDISGEVVKILKEDGG